MKRRVMEKILSLLMIFTLVLQQTGFAQGIGQVDISKYIGAFSGPQQFRPLLLRYFSYDPLTDNFQLLLDKGNLKKVEDSQLKEQGQELLKYFLVGVALPDDNFWVNLRPDSEDQIINRELARTDLGKVLLEADLQLKKDVAKFTSPETPEGREYWNKLYEKAGQIFSSQNITIPTLTRPWIVPGEVIIRENANSAYVYKGTLKVMLEQDHLKNSADYNFSDPRLKELNEYSSQIIRETIIPKLTKEVNSSTRYAALRQVFFSLILSRWFKHKFADKKGLSPKGTVPAYVNLIDSQDLTNLTSKTPWSKTTYFEEYKKSFAQGEYNLKEQVNSVSGPVIRTYFSGGVALDKFKMPVRIDTSSPLLTFNGPNPNVTGALGNNMINLAGDGSNGEVVPTLITDQTKGASSLAKTSSPVEKVLYIDNDFNRKGRTSGLLRSQGLSVTTDTGSGGFDVALIHIDAASQGLVESIRKTDPRAPIIVFRSSYETRDRDIKKVDYYELIITDSNIGDRIGQILKEELGDNPPLSYKRYGYEWLHRTEAASSPLQIRTELTVPEGQEKGFFTNDYHSYRIAELFVQPLEQIPDAVVNAVRKKLNQDIAQGKILSAEVNDYGATDIDIQVTHRYGELNAAVQRLVIEAMKEGVLKAQEIGLLKKGIDVASMDLTMLEKALRVKYQPHSLTERPAESVVRVKMIGAAIGAGNIKLYHEFFITGATPLQSLGFLTKVETKGPNKEKPPVRGFRAIVRRTEDVLKGNFDGPVWEFEKSAAAEIDGRQYPSIDQSLELQAYAGQPNDFVITEIWPVEGSLLPSTEPLVSVVYQPVYGEEGKLRTLNPTFISRSQSGADAVAGVASMFYDVNFVPGGPNGERYVATMPVTKKEARKAPPEGIAYVVIDGWQSKGNGIIPSEKDGVIDHVAINPSALQYERRLAKWLASIMTTHQHDQPYLAPFAAQAQVEPLRKAQRHLFSRAPKEADVDPVMDEVEAKVVNDELLSVDDDKADMGGKFGHNFTPEYMLGIDRATAIEAQEKGEISDGNIIGFTDKGRLKRGTTPAIGDDSHILMLGDKSRNAANSHQWSFVGFTRGYLASMVGNRNDFDPSIPFNKPEAEEKAEKPYGRAQDYQGKEAKAAKANPYFYSRLNPRFFEILREVMPLDYMQMVENLEKGWKYWQEHGAVTGVLPDPFSGNVSQQGIGSARYLVDIAGGERSFAKLDGDKMGPAGINRVIREGVYALLKDLREGTASIPDWIKDERERTYLLKLLDKLKNGLVFEIWDAKAFDEHGNIPLDELPAYADVADSVNELKDESERSAVRGFYDSEGVLKTDLSQDDKHRLADLLKKAGYVPTERIFLDAQQDKEAIYLYLADSDRFNIKQVWSKNTSSWDINNFQTYLDRPMLGSSVTKLGILAGGEYVGKDDPAMVGNSILMESIFAFLEKNPVLLQGDMNGSHWLAAIPTAFKYAVANKESHPILVALRYTLSEDGKTLASVEDVFASKDYAPIRRKMFEFNYKFKQAQLGGQFEPYATNWRTIEAAYPKNKLLKQLMAPDSPFLVKNKPAEQRKLRPIGILGERVALFETATASSSPLEDGRYVRTLQFKNSGAEPVGLHTFLSEQHPGLLRDYGEGWKDGKFQPANSVILSLLPAGVKDDDKAIILKPALLDTSMISPGERLILKQDLLVFTGAKAVPEAEAFQLVGVGKLLTFEKPLPADAWTRTQLGQRPLSEDTMRELKPKILEAIAIVAHKEFTVSLGTEKVTVILNDAKEGLAWVREVVLAGPKQQITMRVGVQAKQLDFMPGHLLGLEYLLKRAIESVVADYYRETLQQTTASEAEVKGKVEAADTAKPEQGDVATTSSPLMNPNESSPAGVGGIDFRAIPMITQPMGNLSGLNFSLPHLSNVENINLSEELEQIQKMLRAGITPSGARLKEFVAACYQKGELSQYLDKIVASLVDLCKLEEEKVDASANELKEVMLILDSIS